jgi:chondroitin AC lyase
LLCVPAAAFATTTPSVETVRQNFLEYTTAAGADRTSHHMVSALASLENDTRNDTAPGFLLSDGSWSDINYKEVPSGTWTPSYHCQRLATMARAYRTPGQAYYNDPQLLTQITAGLAYVSNFYGLTILPNGNWWFWTIGVPLDLGPTLVLMRGAIPQNVYDDCVLMLTWHIGTSPTSKGLVGPTPVGENLAWSCYTHLCLGLLRDDATILGQVRDAMIEIAAADPGNDGIQADLSFHQHGPQLYTGGYGGSFANDVTRYALLTRGSDFALPQAALDQFADYIAGGIAWSLYQNYFDVSVIGREVARSSTSGANGMAALLQATQFPSARQAEIDSAAAMMLRTWNQLFPPELAGLAAMVESAPLNAAWPEGHRHYYQSDYTVHRRPGWFASVKMFSSRTKSGESTNNENILGSRQSDGRFYLVLSGNEYFSRDVWPSLDWTRLPGITVEQKADTANATYGFGTRAFVGGTGDGRNGVSAMDYAPLNENLVAKKSWFFFDDSIVFLTSGILSTSGNHVETVVQQWPLADPNAALTQGNGWMECENIGYWFPKGGDVRVARAPHTGTWAALGASTDTTPHTNTFLDITIDHGTYPAGADDAYVIVPATTASAMSAWVASNPLLIEANTSSVAAVRDRRTNAVGIVFWTASSIDGISSDLPVTVYVVPNGSNLEVYASDPTNGSGTYHLTFPALYTTKDAPYTIGYRSTMVTLSRAAGNTVHVTLTPAKLRRRSAR